MKEYEFCRPRSRCVTNPTLGAVQARNAAGAAAGAGHLFIVEDGRLFAVVASSRGGGAETHMPGLDSALIKQKIEAKGESALGNALIIV